MPSQEDKVKKAKKGMDKFAKYEKCLLRKKNYDDIIEALGKQDYAAVKAIFEQCNVPSEQQNDLLEFAINCFEMRFCQW